jgi:hypothetical protein
LQLGFFVVIKVGYNHIIINFAKTKMNMK